MARLVFSEKEKPEFSRYKIKHVGGWRSTPLLLEPSQGNWWEDPDVLVAFNLPRISACLERLMGTNVVRLTDRKYMKDLRDRIEDEYRLTLQMRIRARELKEIERERLLIIEGKTDVIPLELSDDPIFVVNKAADQEIRKQRAKLKTNRERNSERLKLQGVKWERERLQHEEEERNRLSHVRQRHNEQAELEETYKEENGARGMDLLRIDNEDWRECEQKLKEFLEIERAKMKERSLRVPTPFSNDPKDIQNIVKARQKFRETEQRIRQELEEKFKDDKTYTPSKEFLAKSAASKVSKLLAAEGMSRAGSSEHLGKGMDEGEDEHPSIRYAEEGSEHGDSLAERAEIESTISESKRRYGEQLEARMEDEVQKGILISKSQYDHLRYEEEKIVQLRNAKSIRELYELAEQIIIGDRVAEVVDEEEVAQEEVEEENEPISDEEA